LENDFPKIPKENSSELGRLEINMQCSRRLIFDHLLAVNPCGIQVKNENFHRPTVKSQRQPNLDFSF
jgi:hypothetical protein